MVTKPLFRAGPAVFLAAGILGAFAAGPGQAPASSGKREQAVRQAASITWIHGITEEISLREIGTDGEPYLRELLLDPSFPRRDNVVAHLAWLGGEEAAAALMNFLKNPPVNRWMPEEDRALLIAPRALGHLAARGSATAMNGLLELTGPARPDSILGTAARNGGYTASMVADLVEESIYGLRIAGSQEAVERLESLASGKDRPPLDGLDVQAAARKVLRSTGAGSQEAAGFQRDGVAGPVAQAPTTLDTSNRADEAGLTYANHVDTFFKMDDATLDASLRLATLAVGRVDFQAGGVNTEDDVACCLRVVRSGTAQEFGTAGDGLDTIDDETELNAVLNDNVARVKVVRAINECGGPGMNILACAHTPGASIAMTNSGMTSEQRGLVWIHEYGHNTGLSHNTISQDYLMFASSASGGNRGLTQAECDSYHNPPPFTQMVNVDLGACHDNDLDGLVTGADNCPDLANPDQADGDGNGIGDLCEICSDADGDGFGLNGATGCAGGTVPDCDDLNASVFPGGTEHCDGIDNDCDGTLDVFACGDIDDSGDGSVDGTELSRIGRAFGLCSATPSAEWWYGVDYTFDGCVDGDDLAVLGGFWGCTGTTTLCN